MSGFQVKDVGMFRNLSRFLNEFIGDALEVRDFFRCEHCLNTDITVFVVKITLFLGEHCSVTLLFAT